MLQSIEERDCPSLETWRGLLRGVCGAEELDGLERHLACCDECLTLVDALSSEEPDDEVFSLLREPSSFDPDVEGIDFVALVRDGLAKRSSDSPFEEAARIEAASKGVVGRFVLSEPIGVGGFGIVWRAYDPKLDRDVALKIPRGHDRLGAAALKRFDAEARAAAQLFHPHLVPVLDAGNVEGLPYLVMELCEGPTLARWLKDRTELPSIATAADVVAKLADGVEAAHGQGVLHRDVKPSNVLLFPLRPEVGRVLPDFPYVPRLGDFGLAKLGFGDAEQGAGASTGSDAWRGTPAYMSPEQISKAEGACDARTDVWSLGALLYQLLTGRVPFQGENALEVLDLIRKEPPVAPSALRRGMPRDLETICLKCLEKSPARRYPSAAALRDDLRRFSRGEPILARPPRWYERAWNSAKRRPVRATLIVSAVLAATLLGLMQVRYSHDMRLNLEALRVRDRNLSRRLYASEIGQVWRSIQSGRIRDARDRLDRLVPDPADPSVEDPRGFEWRYLKARTESNPEIRRIEAHKGLVSSLVFSPDRRLMATAGAEDDLVKLWDGNSGAPLAVLAGHASDVNRVAFSPDGKTLASASDDKTVRLWDVETRKPRLILDGGERMFHLSFSHDGELLATAGRTKTVLLWNATTGELLKRFQIEDILGCLGFAPNSRRLLIGDVQRKYQLVDVPRPLNSSWVPTPFVRLGPGFGSRGVAYAFSPDGRALAIGGVEGWLALFDAETGKIRKLVTPGRQEINCLAYLPDGGIVTGDDGGELRVWTDEGESTVVARLPDERVSTLAVASDGSVAAAGPSGIVRFLRPNRYLNRRVDLKDVVTLTGVVISGSLLNSQVVHSDWGAGFKLLDVGTGKDLALGNVKEGKAPVMSSSGRWCAVARRGGGIEIWDVENRKRAAALAADLPGKYRPPLAFSGDDRWILVRPVHPSEAKEYSVQVIEWRTGRWVATLEHSKPINAAAFSRDGRTVVTVSDGIGENAILWDTATWKRTVELRGHRRNVNTTAFSPDGRNVATGSHDGTVRIWNVDDGAPLATLHQESVWIRSLAYSPDGKTLVSGNEAGKVTFWQVATGQELFSISNEHSSAVLNLVFVDRGRRLVSASARLPADCEMVVWDADAR